MRFIVFIVILYFSWEKYQYFGWNTFPKTDAEFIANGINILMCILYILTGQSKNQENDL